MLSIVVQVSDFDFVDKKSFQADAIVPDALDTYVDDEEGPLAQEPDHEYGSGYFTTDLPDSAGNFQLRTCESALCVRIESGVKI